MATTTLITNADAAANKVSPDANQGYDTVLRIRWDTDVETHRTFVGFDIAGGSLSSIIESATLRLYCLRNDGDTVTIDCRRVIGAWTEGGLTWNNQPDVSTLYDSTIPALNSWVEWDVTQWVSGIMTGAITDYGLRLDIPDADNTNKQFWSRQHTDPLLYAQLVVVHYAFSPARIAQIAWG